jgi:hypothetical protein
MELVAIRRWGMPASSYRLVRASAFFTRQQLYCPSATTLFGLLLFQQGRAIQFWILYSVLQDQLWDPTPALFWELDFLPQPHSQPLCLSWPLLNASGSSGRLSCHPTPALSLCCFSHIHSLRVHSWEFSFLSHPFLWDRFSVPPPPLLSVLDYSLLFIVFSFVGGIQSAQGLCWIMSWGLGRGAVHGACSPVHSEDSCK